MTPDPKPTEPDYSVEIIEDDTRDEASDETENIEQDGDPFGDNFA